MADRNDTKRRIVRIDTPRAWHDFYRRVWCDGFGALDGHLKRSMEIRRLDMSDVAIEATAESNTLRMQRVFKAPRAIVFDAFTDRSTFKTWWGPKGATAEVDELDATVGGKYRVRMIMPDCKIHRLNGTYMEVDTPNRLVYS